MRAEFGASLVATHMAQMTAMSRKRWPPIVEREGFLIIEDRAYQGFDDRPEIGYPAIRFWCRSIHVRRVIDGKVGWGIGPQAEAYHMAIRHIEGA